MQIMSGRCWNVNAFLAHTLLFGEFQTSNGTRGVHLKLCLGSCITILIFQSPVVTDDYVEVAIKEIQVFNQDSFLLTLVCGSVRFRLLMCFLNDDEKENIWLWGDLETTISYRSAFSLVHFVKTGGKHHVIYNITWGSFSWWRKNFRVHKLPLLHFLGEALLALYFWSIFLVAISYPFFFHETPSMDSSPKCLGTKQKEFIESGNFG